MRKSQKHVHHLPIAQHTPCTCEEIFFFFVITFSIISSITIFAVQQPRPPWIVSQEPVFFWDCGTFTCHGALLHQFNHTNNSPNNQPTQQKQKHFPFSASPLLRFPLFRREHSTHATRLPQTQGTVEQQDSGHSHHQHLDRHHRNHLGCWVRQT